MGKEFRELVGIRQDPQGAYNSGTKKKGSPVKGSPLMFWTDCILASPLPADNKLPGYGQQDDSGKAGAIHFKGVAVEDAFY